MIRLLSEQIEDLYEFSQNPHQRIRTGLEEIDALIGGPAPGEVCLVIGRSFAGKSVVGQNIVFNNRTVPSIFFSLEMPYIQAVGRLYSIWSNTPNRDVQDMVSSGSLPPVVKHMSDDFPEHAIIDKSGTSLKSMSHYLEEYESIFGFRPEFVVIDYLELLGGAKKTGEGWTSTEVQATSVKDWAKDEEMRVFVLHQTNRNENSWEPPTEDSARGAGYTEADFVIGMYQPSRNPDLEEHEWYYLRDKVRFNVLKNRAYGDSTRKDIEYSLQPSLRIIKKEELIL